MVPTLTSSLWLYYLEVLRLKWVDIINGCSFSHVLDEHSWEAPSCCSLPPVLRRSAGAVGRLSPCCSSLPLNDPVLPASFSQWPIKPQNIRELTAPEPLCLTSLFFCKEQLVAAWQLVYYDGSSRLAELWLMACCGHEGDARSANCRPL